MPWHFCTTSRRDIFCNLCVFFSSQNYRGNEPQTESRHTFNPRNNFFHTLIPYTSLCHALNSSTHTPPHAFYQQKNNNVAFLFIKKQQHATQLRIIAEREKMRMSEQHKRNEKEGRWSGTIEWKSDTSKKKVFHEQKKIVDDDSEHKKNSCPRTAAFFLLFAA